MAYRNQGHKKVRLRLVRFIRNVSILGVGLLLIAAGYSPVMGSSKTDGIFLFQQEKYDDAASCLATNLKDQPENPAFNFYMGRSLLALNQSAEALVYLKKAAELEPGNADYQFWQGVGYWATMDFEGERRSYLKALDLDRDHLSANLYLGHNYLDRGAWKRALAQYDRVLRIDPTFPDALFNRAVALEKQKKTREAREAWKNFLDRYRSGLWAFQAVEQLNRNGDFSYRTYWLGPVNTVMPKVVFAQGDNRIAGQSQGALKAVKTALERNSALSVHIVVYSQGNKQLAAARANALKSYILNSNPAVSSSRVKLSWFDVPEKVSSGGKTYAIKESVNFITVTN